MKNVILFKPIVVLLTLLSVIALGGCQIVIPETVAVDASMSTEAHSTTIDYPTKPITMLVGYKEGGGADSQARVIASIMEAELGQPVEVINMPGAGGTVSIQELLTTDPDGYNIAFAVSTGLTYNPVLQALDYQVDDFAIPAIMSTFQTAMITYDEAPYSTWTEFVAWVQENPGAKYMFLGAESKLIMEMIADIEGLELEYIAASGGAAVIPALQAGEVDIAFSGGIHGRYLDVEEGKMKVLASTLPKGQTLQATPDVPNLYDLGYNAETAFQGILVAPAELPNGVYQTLVQVAEVAANHPDYAAVMAKLQYPITFVNGEAAHAVIAEQRAAFEATQ